MEDVTDYQLNGWGYAGERMSDAEILMVGIVVGAIERMSDAEIRAFRHEIEINRLLGRET